MGEPLKTECEHFLECIAKGTPPLTNASRGASVVRALEGIARSLDLRGAEVTL
jgi:UDP-2-acetamido-3-amino-2,3-dideoxy-glucuronate N-acetyltransferase